MPDANRLAEIQDRALTPTQVAIAAMRAQRAVLGYPATGPEWLLLAALDESEAENAELHGKVTVLERQLKRLDNALIEADDAIDDAYAVPGKAVIA